MKLRVASAKYAHISIHLNIFSVLESVRRSIACEYMILNIHVCGVRYEIRLMGIPLYHA